MTRPGFLFCACPDGELTRRHIHSLLGSQPETWRIRTFWADEELPDAFWEALSLTGLLGDATAVVLRRAEKLPASAWKKLHPVLSRFKERVWPIFCLEGEWSKGEPQIPAVLKRQKFYQLAERKNWIWRSPGFNRQSLTAYLKQWAASKKKSFTPQALTLAGEILPLDGAGVNRELEKIELLTRDRDRVTPQDLSMVSFQPDMDAFAFLRALQTRGREVEIWRKIIHNQLDSGQDMVLPFLGLMLWEARQLWQLLAGEAAKVRLPPGIKKAKSHMAHKMGQKRLAQIWTYVLDAETGIKTGEVSPGQAMEILVSKLMLLFDA